MFALLNCQVWFAVNKHPRPVIRSQFTQLRYAARIQSECACSDGWPLQLQMFLIQSPGIQTPQGLDVFHIPHSHITYLHARRSSGTQWK